MMSNLALLSIVHTTMLDRNDLQIMRCDVMLSYSYAEAALYAHAFAHGFFPRTSENIRHDVDAWTYGYCLVSVLGESRNKVLRMAKYEEWALIDGFDL